MNSLLFKNAESAKRAGLEVQRGVTVWDGLKSCGIEALRGIRSEAGKLARLLVSLLWAVLAKTGRVVGFLIGAALVVALGVCFFPALVVAAIAGFLIWRTVR